MLKINIQSSTVRQITCYMLYILRNLFCYLFVLEFIIKFTYWAGKCNGPLSFVVLPQKKKKQQRGFTYKTSIHTWDVSVSI